MLIRIRSRDGNFRFDLNPTDDISLLVKKILETSSTIDPATLALSQSPQGGESLVSSIQGDLNSLGLTHGDLLFASYSPLATNSLPSSTPAPAASTSTSGGQNTLSGKVIESKPFTAGTPISAPHAIPTGSGSANGVNGEPREKRPWELIEEDPVDVYWEKQDGKIPRKKGENGCKCGPKSMCDYCMPLEPYDSTYHTSHAIKHLSFHAHLLKLTSSAPPSTSSATYIPPLTPPSFKVQVPCSSSSHPSWPAGICTKCQPSAVTLSRQTFRMVDHVEFSDPSLIEGFLGAWRGTGCQRFGWLIGRLGEYKEVPMGVKAVVEAIWEPKQEGHEDGVAIDWEDWKAGEEEKVEKLAKDCGLMIVGCIYTDLTPVLDEKGNKTAKVLAKRHANSFFLSSLEILFASQLQRSHPTPTRFSSTGHFSSRFVTCVISGDLEEQVSIEAYQVSDQAMVMTEADMVEASVDPGVMRVKEEGKERYVPDVFYRYKNGYGIEVKESAKPCFPVEYLLVNVTHGFPLSPSPLFTTPTPFPLPNRSSKSSQPSIGAAAKTFALAIKKLKSPEIVGAGGVVISDGDLVKESESVWRWLSDWGLLRFLEGTGVFDQEDFKLVIKIATSSPTPSATDLITLFQSQSWQTFLTVAESEAPPQAPLAQLPSSGPQTTADGFEIPPDVDVPPDQFNAAQNPYGPGGGDVDMDDHDDGAVGGGGGAGGMVACPHCTFENEAGKMDCDVCGLPLAG